MPEAQFVGEHSSAFPYYGTPPLVAPHINPRFANNLPYNGNANYAIAASQMFGPSGSEFSPMGFNYMFPWGNQAAGNMGEYSEENKPF